MVPPATPPKAANTRTARMMAATAALATALMFVVAGPVAASDTGDVAGVDHCNGLVELDGCYINGEPDYYCRTWVLNVCIQGGEDE